MRGHHVKVKKRRRQDILLFSNATYAWGSLFSWLLIYGLFQDEYNTNAKSGILG